MDKIKNSDDLVKKLDEMKKKGSFDISSDEDLSIALMNLISIEEHMYFSAQKTENSKYLEMLHEVREIRKKHLKKIVKNPKGEEWCISKHLLASSMRLIEVGNKHMNKGENKNAQELFQDAFFLYSLFWGINLKLVKDKEIVPQDEKTWKSKISDITKKIIDCCKE